MRRSLAFGPLLAAALAMLGCEEQGTEIVFEVTTGYLVPEQVDGAAITVLGLGRDMTPDSAERCQTPRSLRLGPGGDVESSAFTFAVRQGEVCDRRVFFEVTLTKGALDVVTSSGTATFEPGKSVRVVISIPRNTTCESGRQWCDTACTDVTLDGANCGWCGNECGAGKSCVSGWCRCPSGAADCDGTCIDVRGDAANCGGCGRACASGQVCVDGACTTDCPDPLTNCGGRCTDTRSDPRNCGGCGTTCGDGTRCLDGSCGSCNPPQGGPCDPIAQCGCAAGQRCDAAQGEFYSPTEICVPEGSAGPGEQCDTWNLCARGLGCFRGVYGEVAIPGERKAETDEPGMCLPWCVLGRTDACDGNPGACRALLGQAGQPVEYGVCLPFTGVEICNYVDDDGFGGVDDGIDTRYDPWNCGRCFRMCEPGQSCQDGSCAACSMWPFLECEGACTDVSWDRANCGACGTRCGLAEACVGGVCQPDCAEWFPLCPDEASGSLVCVDTERDPDHCGYCEAPPCGRTEVCQWGTCMPDCDGGLRNCDRRCTDVGSDPRNCGDCGNACPTGQDCEGGSCVACTPAPARAGGSCYIPTQCGCAADQVCVLADLGGGFTEVCRSQIAELRELWLGCHLTLADCEAGLQCVPSDVPFENRCIRPCVADEECPSERCLHDDVPEGFAPYGVCGAMGGPCVNDWDCPGDMPVCITMLGSGFTVPGGYCTLGCDPDDPRCPPGSHCVGGGGMVDLGRIGAACLAECVTDADCRTGYRCLAALGNVCFPEVI